VIGAIGISVILVGGSSIRSGAMTIGDLFMYISMIALLTMPVIQLANIGTQITEAFAGLDRIREIRRMATEDEEDADSDCAGEAGAGVYSLSYWTKMNMQSETDNGYSKTVDFNGQKAVEGYDKGSDTYELTYVASDRLLVTIKGEKTGLDAVKGAAQGLNLKAN
jgi:ABC-type multidrug transport system fused ATPase/permease subunit